MGITVYRHISPIATGISRKIQVWIGLAMTWNNHLTKWLCISSIKGKSVSSSTCNNHIINQIKRIDCNIFPVVLGAGQLKLTWLPHVLWPFKPWNGHLHTSKRSLWTWAKHQPPTKYKSDRDRIWGLAKAWLWSNFESKIPPFCFPHLHTYPTFAGWNNRFLIVVINFAE